MVQNFEAREENTCEGLIKLFKRIDGGNTHQITK